MRCYLLRVGLFGHVGRFRALGADAYPRGTRVVCRTSRGLEIADVLAEANGVANGVTVQADGALLRRMTAEDELLAARLEKHKHEAQAACESLLAERGLSAVLLDVEPLLDGRSLFFYFLGPVAPEVEAITEQLAAAYEARAGLRKFAETLLEGCGPGCGTGEAAGGGCLTDEAGGCAGCSIAGACGTRG